MFNLLFPKRTFRMVSNTLPFQGSVTLRAGLSRNQTVSRINDVLEHTEFQLEPHSALLFGDVVVTRRLPRAIARTDSLQIDLVQSARVSGLGVTPFKTPFFPVRREMNDAIVASVGARHPTLVVTNIRRRVHLQLAMRHRLLNQTLMFTCGCTDPNFIVPPKPLLEDLRPSLMHFDLCTELYELQYVQPRYLFCVTTTVLPTERYHVF